MLIIVIVSTLFGDNILYFLLYIELDLYGINKSSIYTKKSLEEMVFL